MGLMVNSGLLALDLSYNYLGDAGGPRLVPKALQGQLAVDPNGLHFGDALKANVTLQRLDLSHSRLGDAPIVALAGGLQVNYALQELRLAGNMLRAAAAEASSTALQVNATLWKLDVSHN